MPRRNDIHKILLIGSGPIVIGQACEFDYSGTQACKALREEGYEVVLVNSNPATIMTDPEMADRTYIEPITWEIVANHRGREARRPAADAGGTDRAERRHGLHRHGVLEKYGVEMIGAKPGRDRQGRGPPTLQAGDEENRPGRVPRRDRTQPGRSPRSVQQESGCRASSAPASRMGGSGRRSPTTAKSSTSMVATAWSFRPIHEVLVEESIIGWKEYEMEVMRDVDDNVVIICSIENFDPMGVHTGDSITVAPAQTLSTRNTSGCATRRWP